MDRQSSVFGKLRSRTNTYDSSIGPDEWFIPYNARPSLPTRESGIGLSPVTQKATHGNLLSVFTGVGGGGSSNAGGSMNASASQGVDRDYTFPRPTVTANNTYTSTYAQPASGMQMLMPRRQGTLVKSPSYSSISDMARSSERMPSSSSVPTGLNAPKMLFSPLSREIRAQQQIAPPTSYRDPLHQSHSGSHTPRQRTVSAPKPGRSRLENPYESRAESRRWAVPTMCDMFLLPRPHLLPHLITPPTSPDEEAEKRLSITSSSDTHNRDKVLEDGQARMQEQEEWTGLVKRRGRSLSLGSTAPPPGAPMIGNVRARSREREGSRSRSNSLVRALTPSSKGGERKRSASFGSRWSGSRKPSDATSRRESKRQSSSFLNITDDDSRETRTRQFPQPFPSNSSRHPSFASRRDLGTASGQALLLHGQETEDSFRHSYSSDTAYRKRSTSMPYQNGHSHTRSDPGLLSAFGDRADSRARTGESRYPTAAIPAGRTLQFKQPSVADKGGVVVISKSPARRTTTTYGAHGGSTFRPPAPLDLSKPLPNLPVDDTSPMIPESGPSVPVTAEIGLALSPDVGHRASQRQLVEGSPTPKTAPLSRSDLTSPISPTKSRLSDGGSATARAFLAKQQQRARTKRAFQSPTHGPILARRQRESSVPLSALSATASSASSMASPLSSASVSAMSDGPGARRKTALEEAIGRSRAASVGVLQEQQQRMSPTRAALLDRPSTAESTRARGPGIIRTSAPPPPRVSLNPPDAEDNAMKRVMSSPPLAYPISTEPSPRTRSRAAFLDVQRPGLPHVETGASKVTVYTDASEGWSRVGDSAGSTPQSERKRYIATPHSETDSPAQSMDDRDFQGLFFRTPHDRNGSFSNTPIPDRYAPSRSDIILPRAIPSNLPPIGLGYELEEPRSAGLEHYSDPVSASTSDEATRRPSEGGSDGTTDELATPQLIGGNQVDQQPYMAAYLDPMAAVSATESHGRTQQRLGAPWISGRPGTPESMDASGSERDDADRSEDTHGTMVPIVAEGREFPFPRSQETIRNLNQAMANSEVHESSATPKTPDGKRRLHSDQPNPSRAYAPLSPGTFGIVPTNVDRHHQQQPSLPPISSTQPPALRDPFATSGNNDRLAPIDVFSTQQHRALSPHRSSLSASPGGGELSASPIPGNDHRHSAAVSFFDEFPSPPTANQAEEETSLMSSMELPAPKVQHASAFGQLVTGPPGAGKSTYCHGLHQFLTAIGRPVHIVNLDPAVPNPPYPCSINITELITLDSIMEEYGLGPNGAMLYAVEYLEANFDWLIERLDEVLEADGGNGYVVFDTPGQVEIWTNHDSLRHVVEKLVKMDYRLAAVHLSDAHYITDASKFISVVLLALRAMLQMEMPHVNVLSKIDLISTYGELPFDLSYYTEVQDLSYLLEKLDSEPRAAKFGKLNKAMVELVDGFGLVGFETLAVEDKSSMINLVRLVDKMTGYIFVPHSDEDDGTNAINTQALFGSIAGLSGRRQDVRDVQERWLDNKEAYDEWEREEWRKEGEERARARKAHLDQSGQHLHEGADDGETEM
ncbi:cytoplasmic protein [Kwoniella heveanensis CBS 569]|nr:cytoplasmic protein [Kwoniella heveanensis CBS 569]